MLNRQASLDEDMGHGSEILPSSEAWRATIGSAVEARIPMWGGRLISGSR